MKSRYTLKTRLVSFALSAAMMFGIVPKFVSVKAEAASSPSKIRTQAELSNNGVNIVPDVVTSNESFMNTYVYRTNRMNLNDSFELASSMNASGAYSDSLPLGTIDGNKNKQWYVSYKWEPTQAERDVIARSGVDIVFKANMIPNYHKHWYIFWTEKHWSTSSIRLTRSDANGNNTWTYGQNDYGYKPNGDTIASYTAAERDSGQPQAIKTQYWSNFPASKAIYYNAYYRWTNDCGNPKTSGAVCYLVGGGYPYICDVTLSGDTYQRIPDGGTTGKVTLHFDEKIRFADNAAHDDIKVYLDAEYLEQTSKTGGFQIAAKFVEMGDDYLTFQFDVKEEYEHFKITGLSSNQPDLQKETDLKVYDGHGNDLGVKNVRVDSLITDMLGNSATIKGYNFKDHYYDGIYPKMTKVDISGNDISALSTKPATNWNANSGNNRFVYAGEKDKMSFKVLFSEDIKVPNLKNVRAVLSIKGEDGNPIELVPDRVTGRYLIFKDLTITQAMRDAGDQIYIEYFKNLTVTDYAGNPCTTNLTSGIMKPAQNITLDVDKPIVTSSIPDSYILSTDPLVYSPYTESMGANYFSFPVTFQDMDNNGADNSGIAGMDIVFSLNMPSGNKYGYRWAMDTNQTVSANTKWNNGTTGAQNTYKDLADGTQYWVHIQLDANTDYDYTTAAGGMDENGIYFIGTLDFSGVTDWAGNKAAAGASYTLKQQVDDTAPSGAITSRISVTPNYTDEKVSFSTSFRVTDDYSIEKVSYRWLTMLGSATEYTPVTSEWQTLTAAELGSGLNKEVRYSTSYTYDYSAADAARLGKVKLEVMVEDRAGNHVYAFAADPAYFNYTLASSNSTVTVNDAANPVKMPDIFITSPQEDSNGDYRNRPRSLVIIPIPDSVDENGQYTRFLIWDPWDWLEKKLEYPHTNTSYSNPFDRITAALNNQSTSEINLGRLISGSFYVADGTVDIQNNSAEFRNLAAHYLRDELQWIQDFFDNYYGRMDIYIATTSALTEFYEINGNPYEGYVQTGENSAYRNDPYQGELLSFTGAESVIDVYSVYLANKADYTINTVSVTNAEGKTDAEAERKLNYTYGDIPPVQNLDNVAVTIQITNESDKTAALGQGYGLEFLDYSQGNAAFKLYYVGDSKRNEMTADNLIKTWDLVKTGDGTQTITFEPGLCVNNGWYRLVVEIYDTNNQTTETREIDQFFMDTTALDITIDDALKSYSNWNTGVGETFKWEKTGIEAAYSGGEEIKLGLAAVPEGWEMNDAYISFSSTARPEGDNARGAKDLSRVRVYNHSYNASAELASDAGLWLGADDTYGEKYRFTPYLADLTAGNTEPYGTTVDPKLPFVAGRNLIVYEIQASNGMVTTKEIVIDVYDTAAVWSLEYELTYGEGTENAISAEVWPVGSMGEALTLNTTDKYDQTKYNFRQVGAYGYNYAESYTYDSNVVNLEYYMLDPQGNISTNKLSILHDDGSVVTIDSNAPTVYLYADSTHPLYASIIDSGYGSSYDGTGNTFFFTIEAADSESSIDWRDITLTFDEAYSKVLSNGTMGDDGRLTMSLPLALDENGELLKNADGTYAVWEDFGTSNNGIFRTQMVVTEEENDWTGELETVTKVHVFGTWRFSVTDEEREALGDSRTLTVNVYDAHRNVASESRDYGYNGDISFNIGYPQPFDWQDGYYTESTLKPEGTVGFYSETPFSSVNGYGAGDMFEYLDKGHLSTRFYSWEAPMITNDGEIIGEDEYGDPIKAPYVFTVTDLFGQTIEVPVSLYDLFGQLGIEVSFSNTKPTNQPVTVYANTTGNIEKIASIVASDGTVGTIDPTDPSKASITVSDNCLITITTDAEPASQRVVKVSNIDKELGQAYIVYYDQNYNILDPSAGATEVTAVLACDSEFLFATNGPEEYKFPFGTLAGETYTFEYQDEAGNTGTITATLPVDLVIPPFVDKEAPDVTVSMYAGMRSSYEFVDRFDNPDYDDAAGESEVTAKLNDPDIGGVRAKTFRFVLTIDDYSATKVVIAPVGSTAPADYASAVQGSTVDNVSLSVSRKTATVDVTDNTEFDIHIIDEKGNVNSIRKVRITSIDNVAPVLTPRYETGTDAETGFSVVTATFYPTEAERLAIINALSANMASRLETVKDDEGNDVSVIRFYHIFEENGSYSFIYEDDLGNIGEAFAQVKGMNNDAAVVNSLSWYGTRIGSLGNVTPDKSDPVNRDVTAQLRLNKAISKVELFVYDQSQPDGIGEPLGADAPVKVSFTATTIDVIYQQNVDHQIVVRFTASANGRKGTHVLPAVGCIDKTAPTVTLKGTELAQDKRSIRFTFETDEASLFSWDMSQGFGTSYQWVAKDDKAMTFYFVDKAGNQASYTVRDFAGLDLAKLETSYSASADGSKPTSDPAIDLNLAVGDSLYVHVNKAAKAVLNGTDLGQFTAGAWNEIVLPEFAGVYILKLTDVNTGDVLTQPVYVKAADRIAPVIDLASTTVLVYEDATTEEMMNAINDGVTVTDNVDTNVSYTVKGYPASPAEGGLYTLTYTAKDAAGNQVTATRYLYIMTENTPIILINGEVALPFGTVHIAEAGKITMVMRNMAAYEDQPITIKFRKGIYTTGQMKYYATTVENMEFEVTETGHYTIHVRGQDRTEFVTYIYVEG